MSLTDPSHLKQDEIGTMWDHWVQRQDMHLAAIEFHGSLTAKEAEPTGQVRKQQPTAVDPPPAVDGCVNISYHNGDG